MKDVGFGSFRYISFKNNGLKRFFNPVKTKFELDLKSLFLHSTDPPHLDAGYGVNECSVGVPA